MSLSRDETHYCMSLLMREELEWRRQQRLQKWEFEESSNPMKRRRDEDGEEKDRSVSENRLANGTSHLHDHDSSDPLPLFHYADDEEEETVAALDNPDDVKPRGILHHRDTEVRRDCPYLDTVNRQVLDFDFEKFCSVSLSNLNVYACLVCGKYFQGRGRNSHAYTHSLEAGHHVFINLLTEKIYCLPDGYEVKDPSLDDIRHVLNPRFFRMPQFHSNQMNSE